MANEKRLIDANEARKRSTHDIITHFLDRCPTVDAVEVVHGWWIDCSNGWMCSACERDNTYAKPYCPNCGAKMDGDGNA